MAVIIKTFETPNGKYVYDRETNSILSVNDTEYLAFRRLEMGSDTEEDGVILSRYKEQGYLKESCLQDIEHPATNLLQFQLESCLKQIVLQVTQDCNLRCSYCTYGGSYDYQRTHSKKTMPLETMKKSIDFIMKRSSGVAEISIGFYGGEPFLEIAKIKDCVTYVKERYDGKKVNYTITTNGTVMNDDIISFLEDNEFGLFISIDGPKELHDMNRVYANGKGSFEDIMSNVKYIKHKFPNFFQRVSFNNIVAPNSDFHCVNDFFDANDVLTDNLIQSNTINMFNMKEDIRYTDQFYITDSYERMKFLLSKINLYDNDKVSKLFLVETEYLHRFYETLSKVSIPKKSHPSGPCLPGVMRPFVDIDGRIFPCERVNEESHVMQMGHIDTGLDVGKAKTMLNVAKLTPNECIDCWCFLHCSLCVAACDGGNELSGVERLKNCSLAKNTALSYLYKICLLIENGYDFEKQIAIAKGRQIHYG